MYKKIHEDSIKTLEKNLRQHTKNSSDAVCLTGYIDYIQPKQLTSNVMRGVDTYHRPFIVFCVKDAKGNEIAETLFQRHGREPNNWAIGCHKIEHIFSRSNPLDDENVEYGRRLVNGEPCGIRYFDGEQKLAQEKGESTIQLCQRN